MDDFTLGVEEEYQVVDPATRELRSDAQRVLTRAERQVGDEVTGELYLSQVEIGTPVCQTLAEVRREVIRLRRAAAGAAAEGGCRIAAAGTHPFSHWAEQELTPKTRYRGIVNQYQQLAREEVIFGNHVHVGIDSREAAIQIMNRARLWLAPILALAANSPFWLGIDSGYASFGREMWRRWPMAGVPPVFSSRADYDDFIRLLMETRTIAEPTKLYWDIRPSERFETLEFRVTDVCMSVDEAVLVAGLIRALARTCHLQAERDEPVPGVRTELLVAANWRAARYGIDAELLDVKDPGSVPAKTLIQSFLSFVRPALEEQGDWEEVSSLLTATLARGNGANRQRKAFARRQNLADVVDAVITETSVP
ncbi:MAG: carboxylate-amine ligase [Candidatus Dormibacteraeota bacterium]|nr:carboxylate-amine ligase [Candidatus Dormibacteraeota bacterium]